MTFKRVLHPQEYATGHKLTSDLVGIGFRLAAPFPKDQPNIEDTLVAASIEGVVREDFRVLALLVDWLEIHIERVNIDRLTKLVCLRDEKLVRAFWASIAHWQRTDPRMKKLFKTRPKERVDLIPGGSDYLIQRKGEDERFARSPLRVASQTLRHRPSDILGPTELAQKHSAYRWRTVIGPSYRADMWAVIEANPLLKANEVAMRTYGSWPTAWKVKRDWTVLNSSRLRRPHSRTSH
ncbi:MAG: hypothetical protein C5B49_14915 [Bdellovibrio sp.]|nr:MAG: hypothetical protein C5B49_14915 [Bdellovibrio sp.]